MFIAKFYVNGTRKNCADEYDKTGFNRFSNNYKIAFLKKKIEKNSLDRTDKYSNSTHFEHFDWLLEKVLHIDINKP